MAVGSSVVFTVLRSHLFSRPPKPETCFDGVKDLAIM